jgi:hypothetical protein
MKILFSLFALGILMGNPTNAQVPPVPEPDMHLEHQGDAVELFPNVCYKNVRNMHPCAVPRIVLVPDPCACLKQCGCCEPSCVAIQICVPPEDCCCSQERHLCKKGGLCQRYCFGKYSVDIRVKKGCVVVCYKD